MLFEHIGTEWARGIAHEDYELDPSLEVAVQSALAAHPAEFAEAASKFSIELHQAEPVLLARARRAIRSGQDIEQIGRVLVSVGPLSEEGKAAGHFLMGFARRFDADEGQRHLELARMSYRNVRLRDMEALSALTAKAADLALSDTGSTEGFEAAVSELADVAPSAARRLASAVEHYLTVIRLTHGLPTADEVPRSFPIPFTDDDLQLLRFAMIRSVRRPAHLIQIAGWIQSLRGLPSDSTEELDIIVRVLHDARSHDDLVPILRDMVARGDERPGTLMWLADALTETGNWPEAKALLIARVGDRPGPEVVGLLYQLVMLCATARDPEHEHWLETLRSVDAERARYGQAPLAKYRNEPVLDDFFGIVGNDSAWEQWVARTAPGQRVYVTIALQALAITYRKGRAFPDASCWSAMSVQVARTLPPEFGPRQHPLGIGRDRLIGSCLSTLAEIEKEDGAITLAHDLLLEVEQHYNAEEERRRQEGITEQPAADRILSVPSVRASLYEDLARSAMQLGDEAQARRYHELWIQHRNEVPTAAAEISELVLKSRYFLDMKRPDAALEHLHRAVEIADRDRGQFAVARNAGHAYRSLARTYGALGAPRVALATLEKARSLAEERPDWGGMAANEVIAAGIVRDRPDLGDAIQHLLNALEYHSTPVERHGRDTWLAPDGTRMRIIDLDSAWPVLLQAAGILEERQRLKDAATYLRLATGIAERVRNGAVDQTSRITVQDQRSDAYLRLARIQLQNVRETPGTDAEFDNAWLTLEALRARTFLDAVGDHELAPPSGVPSHLARREADLLDRRRKLRLRPTRDAGFWDEQQSVNRDLASTWEAMARESPAAASYVAIREARPASHTEIAGLLAERPASPTVVVNMLFPDDEHLVLLAVASGDHYVRAVSSPVDRKSLTRFVGEHFGTAARVRYLATDLENSFHREFSGVVRPLADLCDPGQTLVICPAAPLHHVPLGAVRVGIGPYVLLQRNPLAISPSASLLRSRHPASQESREPAYSVLGDPTGNLPKAWAEAYELAELWSVKPCMREDATKEALIDALRTCQVVHVAAHAMFDDSQPLQSGVHMANGMLSAHEILQVPAQELDLVTMSACETGLSQVGQSEDPVGLSRALLFAGANSVVTSLWRVPDSAARDVMTKFHKNLSSGQTKADALRGAALAARSGSDDARFHRWAAFILTGAWD